MNKHDVSDRAQVENIRTADRHGASFLIEGRAAPQEKSHPSRRLGRVFR